MDRMTALAHHSEFHYGKGAGPLALETGIVALGGFGLGMGYGYARQHKVGKWLPLITAGAGKLAAVVTAFATKGKARYTFATFNAIGDVGLAVTTYAEGLKASLKLQHKQLAVVDQGTLGSPEVIGELNPSSARGLDLDAVKVIEEQYR